MSHPIVRDASMVHQFQAAAESMAVRQTRQKTLAYLQNQRTKLAADPTATESDLTSLDTYIGWAERRLGWLPPEEEAARDERRRMKTRERVRALRARQRASAVTPALAKEGSTMSDDDKAAYRSKTGPLGPEKFENDPEDISPEDLLKSYGEEFIKEMDAFADEIKARSNSTAREAGRSG